MLLFVVVVVVAAVISVNGNFCCCLLLLWLLLLLLLLLLSVLRLLLLLVRIATNSNCFVDAAVDLFFIYLLLLLPIFVGCRCFLLLISDGAVVVAVHVVVDAGVAVVGNNSNCSN